MTLALCWSAQAVEEHHGVLLGEVRKLDAATKTIVIRAVDGTEHTLHFLEQTAVHGAEATAIYCTDETGHKVAHFFKRAV